MWRKRLNLMSPEDFNEHSILKRRMEFLELRASYLWNYRKADIERAYADVKDGWNIKPGNATRSDKEEEK